MKKKLLLATALFTLVSTINVEAISAAKYITDLSKTDTVNFATDDPGNNPRYIGANPNNYVEFNGEAWRIIGVIDGKVKIIRTDTLDTGYTAIAWDSSPSSVNGGSGISYWAQADLMTELNTDYLNSNLSEDTKWYSGSYNGKNAVFDHTKVIKTDAKEMIADATWYLGSSNYDGTTLYTDPLQMSAETIYNNERLGTPAILNPGTSTSNDGIMDRDKTWTGKVALIYPSDFIYSTSGNETTSREICLSASGWNTNCGNTTWLKSSTNIWTISPATTSGRNIYVFTFNSGISNAGLVSWPSNTKTRPALHLKDNVVIYEGDGTVSNPYKLALANTVEFESNGGNDIETQYIEANNKVTKPTDPTKDNATFLGWYTDENLTTEYNFDSEVTSNLKLYAKWKDISTDNSTSTTPTVQKLINPKTNDNIYTYITLLIISILGISTIKIYNLKKTR